METAIIRKIRSKFKKLSIEGNQVLLFCGLLSGTAGLIYQTLWIRVLSLGVGSTSESLSVVVAIFFLGLALGSWYSKRILPSMSPMKRYAILEIGIGIYALLLIFALFSFQGVMAILPVSGVLRFLVKFVLVALALFPPTFAMGATLPIMLEAYEVQSHEREKKVGLLYGINTLGAVFGALLTGYFLIPKFGIIGANIFTTSLNIFAGLLAFFGWKSSKKFLAASSTAQVKSENTQPAQLLKASERVPVALLYLSVGAVGFSAIAAEVIWSKYLGIFLGTNIYGLGLVLGLFLSGIAIGSLIHFKWLSGIRDKISLFIALIFLHLLATLFSSLGLNLLPTFASVLSYYFGDHLSVLQIKSSLSAIVLFIPTAVSGAMLPVAVELAKRSSNDDVSLRLSRIYSINTLGAILGSLLTGLAIIPLFGTAVAVKTAIAILLLVLFCWTVWRFKFGTSSKNLSWKTKISLVFVLVVSTSLFLFAPKVHFKNIIKSAYFQSANPEASFSEVMKYYSRDYEEFQMIYEGKTAVISLSHDPSDGSSYREYFRLKTNGLNESIYQMKKPKELPQYEALLGFIPFALNSSPKSAFIVGYGGGFTVDFLSSIGIDRVDVAEIESGILKAAGVVFKALGFSENPILNRKNVHLQFEDARAVLVSDRHSKDARKYDIIVSQPSHSWLSGVANLFTLEFFEIVKSRLSERGLFSQWLNLYNMDSKVLASILHTFYSVFPEGAVFTNFADQEMILIGSKSPLSLNLRKLQSMSEDPSLTERLSQTSFRGAYDFVSNFTAGRERVLERVSGAPLNTDRNAYAETLQSKLFYSRRLPNPTPQKYLSDMFNGDFTEILGKGESTSNEFYFGLLDSLERLGRFDKFHALMRRYEEASAQQPLRYQHLGYMALKAQRYATAKKYLTEFLAVQVPGPANEEAIGLLVNVLSDMKLYKELISTVKHYKKIGMANGPYVDCYLADAWISSRRVKEGLSDIQKVLRDYEAVAKRCGSYLDRVVGRYYLSQGQFELAARFLNSYYTADSQDPETVAAMISAYLALGDKKTANSFMTYYQQLAETEKTKGENMVQYYQGLGFVEDAKVLQRLYSLE